MKENFENYLIKNQIKPTKQRLRIAAIVFCREQHFTASDLIEKINKSKLNISQATIYNTLCLFESKGLLKIINLDNEQKFYDTNLSHHHHIYNLNNRSLFDVPEEKISFSKLPKIPESMKVEKTEVVIKVINK
ncbi:MAG: transcriptional repressor [Pseudomonadota bacterium]|nr:transcriptional repressor [Pseudomonadota bacterium]MED5430323.1 transcriptional repressor [Pseudomonadota bacterium]|tara:strand:- start:550 stop:948 length:399 start_codon:yes stop_codon:yes gene_type:complete